MAQSKQPLYPKTSSIYNKIMQLAIAIMLIIMVMNTWVHLDNVAKQNLTQHLNAVGKNTLTNTTNVVKLLLKQNNKIQKNALLSNYIKQLPQSIYIKDARLYDPNGRLLLASKQSYSINHLYGLTDNTLAQNKKYKPFVKALYNKQGKIKAYLRLTFEKKALLSSLEEGNKNRLKLERLMLILAGLIGFLLTRGLNRFSRQGYRLVKP